MINASTDFNSALNFVTTESDPITARISDKMNSAVFNSVFTDIENQINNLYEKIRLLEDIRDYTKDFVVRAIEERRIKILDNLKTIEKLTDNTQYPDMISTVVQPENTLVIYDRDGSVIPAFERDNDLIIMPGQILSVNNVKSVMNKGIVNELSVQKQDVTGEEFSAIEYVPVNGADPFAACEPNITGDISYCQSYRSQTSVDGDLTILYEINLVGNNKCNYINFNPVNCEVTDITLYDADNSTKKIDPANRYFNECRVVKADIKIKCHSYQRTGCVYPATNTDDAFDKVVTGGEIYE